MTEEQDKTEVAVSTNATMEKPSVDELKAYLAKEQETIASYEKKLQYLLADFENLKKRTELDVQNRVNSIIDEIMLKFLSIYDDFVRAKEALAKQKVNTQGLDAILKNMNSFLTEYGVIPIDALGEIFDPKLHEAISVKEEPSLDNDTITAEIRKGYILQNRVIRPSLVEISKTTKTDLVGENNG
ncbi:MAG: nucleotide exchange factor GrpE [Nitrosopumilaceae archaeon]